MKKHNANVSSINSDQLQAAALSPVQQHQLKGGDGGGDIIIIEDPVN